MSASSNNAIFLWAHIIFGMAGNMQFSQGIGRRLKLQDLHVLMTVAQAGSMGKAAQLLNTTQPAVSRSISELEHTLRVRLFDRHHRGIEPTTYGRALLDCAAAVFDDLRQGVRNIEFLSDPTLGEITIGGNEALIAGLLSAVLERLRRPHPGITVHTRHVASLANQYRELRERRVDLVVGRLGSTIEHDIETQILYHDRIFVVAGLHSRWNTRRKIDLTELANEPWGLPPLDTLAGSLIREAFRARGISLRGTATGSPHLLLSLLAKGPFLAPMPDSVLRFGANLPPLKILPVELPVTPWPLGVMTLKNRTISPVVQVFLDCAYEIVKPFLHGNNAATGSAGAREFLGRKSNSHRS
jgi:DNA-binding transcriptional LysR family regulator